MGNDTIPLSPTDSVDTILSDFPLFVIKAIFNAFLTQAFCVLGSVTNIINIVVFHRIGYSESINISLTALAISDFGSCFMFMFRNLAFTPWFAQMDDLPFEPNEISYLISLYPHIFFSNVTKLLTAFVSVERCLCVTMPLNVKSIITKRRVQVFCISSYVFAALPFIPLYYTHRYALKFSPEQNKTILGLVFLKETKQINGIVYPLINIVYTFTPFIIIAASTSFLVVSLRKNSKWRQEMTSQVSNASKKERKVSKMVVFICVLFIIGFFPFLLVLVVQTFNQEISLYGKYKNLSIALGAISFCFECFNSSSNIFIYHRNSSMYKTAFSEIFSCRKMKRPDVK